MTLWLTKRDPETLIGPLLWLLTRLARGRTPGDPAPEDVSKALVAHLTALAAHPSVALHLRLAAGALAIEHRQVLGCSHGSAEYPDAVGLGESGSR